MNCFNFNRKELIDIAKSKNSEYQNAKPFPHIVIDDFLPKDTLEKVLKEIPESGTLQEKHVNHTKYKTSYGPPYENLMGKDTRHLIGEFNSSIFLNFIECLTNIEGLIPDPHLSGGGIHQIRRGGFLKIHADFNWNKNLMLDRRINVILFLNKDWEESYGGHLELWNMTMTQAEKKILPIFNRLIIFNSSDYSHHGHPDPLNCPENRLRNSLAFYYYSSGRPKSEIIHRKHEWTHYLERSGEKYLTRNLNYFLKKFLPLPIIKLIRYLRG